MLLDIDVQFSSGLNVVIGGSSSGKTLLVDSIWRKLSKKSFENSDYKDFDVENINVVNPSEMTPHYLGQNYIMSKVLKISKSLKACFLTIEKFQPK